MFLQNKYTHFFYKKHGSQRNRVFWAFLRRFILGYFFKSVSQPSKKHKNKKYRPSKFRAKKHTKKSRSFRKKIAVLSAQIRVCDQSSSFLEKKISSVDPLPCLVPVNFFFISTCAISRKRFFTVLVSSIEKGVKNHEI